MDMAMDMVMVDMVTMDTMARGLLSLLPQQSQDMAMDMDIFMDMVFDMAMVDMDIMDTMARGLLMLSPVMAMVMVMVMVMDMVMVMVGCPSWILWQEVC